MLKVNIEKATLENEYYRKVLDTTKQTQLVLMSLLPTEDIPEEKHKNTTQFIRVEQGTGVAVVNNKRFNLKDGDILVIPENTKHYIKATGNKPFKLYSLYSPPEHPVGLIHKRQPM